MYYPSSENKGADQLRGYREADLHLCFRQGRLLVFPCGGSNIERSLKMLSQMGLKSHKGESIVVSNYGGTTQIQTHYNVQLFHASTGKSAKYFPRCAGTDLACQVVFALLA